MMQFSELNYNDKRVVRFKCTGCGTSTIIPCNNASYPQGWYVIRYNEDWSNILTCLCDKCRPDYTRRLNKTVEVPAIDTASGMDKISITERRINPDGTIDITGVLIKEPEEIIVDIQIPVVRRRGRPKKNVQT